MSKHRAKSPRRNKPEKQSREEQCQAEWSACVVHLFAAAVPRGEKTMTQEGLEELQRLRERQRAMVRTC